MCTALQRELAALEATPGRAQCIAARGAALASSLSMEAVHAYTAGVLRGAAAAMQPPMYVGTVGTQQAAVISKRSFLRHVSPSTRPWIERVFLPAQGVNVSADVRTAKSAVFS